MPEKLTKNQLKEVEKAELLLAKFEKPTLKSGSVEHRVAKERLLYLLIQEQESIAVALIQKAKTGDVNAIKEVLDRLYGKSKETIDFGGNVTFSLKTLAQQRENMQSKLIEAVQDNEPIDVSHKEIETP